MTNPSLPFTDQSAWETWLEANHLTSDGIWMRIGKKGAGHSSITYAEAVETALCFGWIDGQKQKHDDTAWLQRFTPRRKRSIWSKVNRTKIEALHAEGKLRPAGIKEMEEAKADGRWEAAYDSQSTMAVPADFDAALATNPKAQAFFASLPNSKRYAFLFRIQTTKTPEKRAAKISELVAMLAEEKQFHYP